MTLDELKKAGLRVISILGLATSPVGVSFIKEATLIHSAGQMDRLRYCQALMIARSGEKVVLSGRNISCPAAASAFGFNTLPEGLRSGKGLVGYGIISEAAVGRKMFEDMPQLEAGHIHHLELIPLEQADRIPDIVVVEGEVEKLMWLVLSYLHATGGQRVGASTAVLQATCVDATIVPFLEERLNFGLGCYGCRDATDLAEGESIVGFPVSFLAPIVTHLEYLNANAIPTSRGKKAWGALRKTKGRK